MIPSLPSALSTIGISACIRIHIKLIFIMFLFLLFIPFDLVYLIQYSCALYILVSTFCKFCVISKFCPQCLENCNREAMMKLFLQILFMPLKFVYVLQQSIDWNCNNVINILGYHYIITLRLSRKRMIYSKTAFYASSI